MSNRRDTLFAAPLTDAGSFSFDAQVAEVFPDMIGRSVPGYATIVTMTGLLAQRFASPGSSLYDLGCSLGASTLAMRRNLACEDCRIISVDNSPAMLDRCRGLIAADRHTTPVQLVCADLADIPIEDASVVVLNFTLQFVPRERRDNVIQGIYRGLRPGGIMVLSEKVILEDAHLDALNIELHHEFKRANGYSELEISQKRTALENVMVIDTEAAHRERLRQAGFSRVVKWHQCLNWASFQARP